MRDLVFTAVLIAAAALIVIGVYLLSAPAAMIVAGLLLVPIAGLWFVDVKANDGSDRR